jgi:2'-5' RNA ligase
MRLFAAIVPPPELREELVRLVSSSTLPPPEPPRRRFTLRRGRPATGVAVTPSTPSRELTVIDAAALHVHLASFGNVALGDMTALTRALRRGAATWPRHELNLAGGTALEFAGDDAVWAEVDGDLPRLSELAREVSSVGQRLGFFVDRRRFRPGLAVARITDETTAPYLEDVVARLEKHRSPSWTVDRLSLLQRPNDAEGPDHFIELEQIPLAAEE